MPTRFTLRQLEYLVAVGECGSIALASEKVNVSSPSISSAIAQLEAEFGLPLFVRKHAHGLSLTEGGRQFVEEARAVLAAAGRLNDLANAITGKVRGPLTVGCLTTFAQMVLPSLRRGFCQRFHDVEFHQTERDHGALIEGLRHAELDVALSYAMQIPADLTFVPLASLPPYAVMAPDHPLAGAPEVSAADLAAHPMVLLDMPYSGEYFLSLFTAAGLRPRIAERTRDMAVMRSMVANGFGYSMANIHHISDRAPDGQPLAFVPIRDPRPPLDIGLIHAEGATAASTIRAFVAHCRETVSPETTPGLRPG